MNRLQLPGRLTTAWLEAAARPVEVVMSTRARDRIAASHLAPPSEGPAFAGDRAGERLPAHLVRATMLAHLAWLAEGRSGASSDSVDALAASLRSTFTPVVAGGADAMAEILHALSGTGEAHLDGRVHTADEALRLAGLQPLEPTSADIRAFTGTASVMVAAVGLHAARMREGLMLASDVLARVVQPAELLRSGELADAIERIERLLQESPAFGSAES